MENSTTVAEKRLSQTFADLQKAATPELLRSIVTAMQNAKPGDKVKTINLHGDIIDSPPVEYESCPLQFWSLVQQARFIRDVDTTPLFYPGPWPIYTDDPELLSYGVAQNQISRIEQNWKLSTDRMDLETMLSENMDPEKLQKIDSIFLMGIGPFHGMCPIQKVHNKRSLIQLVTGLGLKSWMEDLSGTDTNRSIVVRAQDPLFSPLDARVLRKKEVEVEPASERGIGVFLHVNQTSFFIGIGTPDTFEAWAALEIKPAVTLTRPFRLAGVSSSDIKCLGSTYLPRTQTWIDKHYKSFEFSVSEDFLGFGDPEEDRKLLLLIRRDCLSAKDCTAET